MRIHLGIRKLIVLILVGSIFLLANVWFVVRWLDHHGVVGWAQHVRSEYITGTANGMLLVMTSGSLTCLFARRNLLIGKHLRVFPA